MIGQLRGILIEKQPPYLMLDVHGVGYALQAPLSTFFNLPALGQEVTLKTHLIIREDAHILYAFSSQDECQLFQEIIKVSGVGPKIALTILSGLTPNEFVNIIQSEDLSQFKRLPGVGTKIAQRIIVDMQSKIAKLNFSQSSAKRVGDPLPVGVTDSTQEAINALVALGYKHTEATKAVSQIKKPQMRVEQVIKEALQGLAKI